MLRSTIAKASLTGQNRDHSGLNSQPLVILENKVVKWLLSAIECSTIVMARVENVLLKVHKSIPSDKSLTFRMFDAGSRDAVLSQFEGKRKDQPFAVFEVAVKGLSYSSQLAMSSNFVNSWAGELVVNILLTFRWRPDTSNKWRKK